jgi:hypothetical protein
MSLVLVGGAHHHGNELLGGVPLRMAECINVFRNGLAAVVGFRELVRKLRKPRPGALRDIFPRRL